jgi:hypothetical protein
VWETGDGALPGSWPFDIAGQRYAPSAFRIFVAELLGAESSATAAAP